MKMQENIEHIIKNCKKVAVVGLSPDESKPSHYVSKCLQEHGFEIFPIYPKELMLFDKLAVPSLEDINEKVDLVLMFRKGEFADELLPIVKKKGIKNFWLQLGITNERVKEECKKAGIYFVQDRCMKIELEKRACI
ncbi:hypothetical protein LR59_02210 [Campylobacter sp. MIT 97-5078]|nr:hypothetical protein LR59_09410 [Campylobacter sp. MIT 97-5078]KGI57444.1 hypothetical protein LR59_01690 [Campylobacter sp. MIT 97-5078]KGI57528.1 hypothetical protein LR59_02210 [Campylobacter sp. MIT 97-5078]